MSDKEILLKIGENLKATRVKKEISQEKLAQLAGVHRNYIGRMERGEQNASILVWIKVCKVLKVGVGEVVDNV